MPTSGPFYLRTLGELRLTGPAGELLAGANTLVFSIGFLRDYGH